MKTSNSGTLYKIDNKLTYIKKEPFIEKTIISYGSAYIISKDYIYRQYTVDVSLVTSQCDGSNLNLFYRVIINANSIKERSERYPLLRDNENNIRLNVTAAATKTLRLIFTKFCSQVFRHKISVKFVMG